MSKNIDVKIIRSNRRSISLEITPELDVIVRAPRQLKDSYIKKFINDKYLWIEDHLEKMEELKEQEDEVEPLSIKELQKLADDAAFDIPPRVKHYANLMGVTYGNITIRNQKTRWGSCTAKGNLNFNCLMMLMPEDVRDYIVVHELSHRKEMNHSKAFWSEVAKIMPEYEKYEKWLKDNGNLLIKRSRKR